MKFPWVNYGFFGLNVKPGQSEFQSLPINILSFFFFFFLINPLPKKRRRGWGGGGLSWYMIVKEFILVDSILMTFLHAYIRLRHGKMFRFISWLVLEEQLVFILSLLLHRRSVNSTRNKQFSLLSIWRLILA